MPAAPESLLKPDSLLRVFYHCGLSAIPIVREQVIKSYLSFEKTEARVHTEAFFREDIVRILHLLTEKRDDETFFRELDEKAPESVPIVDAQTFTLSDLTVPAFTARFRPLVELADADYRRVLEDLAAPVLVFNARRELIFRNKACRRLLRSFQANLGGRQARIEEYLPPEFFALLDRPDPERTYELTTGSGERVTRYRLSRLEAPRGALIVATFFYSSGGA